MASLLREKLTPGLSSNVRSFLLPEMNTVKLVRQSCERKRGRKEEEEEESNGASFYSVRACVVCKYQGEGSRRISSSRATDGKWIGVSGVRGYTADSRGVVTASEQRPMKYASRQFERRRGCYT